MTAVQAGIMFIPGSIAGVCGSLGAGFVIKRTGHYYWLTVASHGMMLSSCVSLVLFSGLLTDSKTGTTAGLALMSFGVGAGMSRKMPLFFFSLHSRKVALLTYLTASL